LGCQIDNNQIFHLVFKIKISFQKITLQKKRDLHFFLLILSWWWNFFFSIRTVSLPPQDWLFFGSTNCVFSIRFCAGAAEMFPGILSDVRGFDWNPRYVLESKMLVWLPQRYFQGMKRVEGYCLDFSFGHRIGKNTILINVDKKDSTRKKVKSFYHFDFQN